MREKGRSIDQAMIDKKITNIKSALLSVGYPYRKKKSDLKSSMFFEKKQKLERRLFQGMER